MPYLLMSGRETKDGEINLNETIHIAEKLIRANKTISRMHL